MSNDTMKLGIQAKDLVTGFEGIATIRVTYLYGCDQYGLTPPAVDGKVNESQYFDVGRLRVTGDGVLGEGRKEIPKAQQVEVKLGAKAKDRITGMEGIVIAKVEHLYGRDQYGLTPPAKEGKTDDTLFFDAGRLDITGKGLLPEDVAAKKPGGVNRDCPKH